MFAAVCHIVSAKFCTPHAPHWSPCGSKPNTYTPERKKMQEKAAKARLIRLFQSFVTVLHAIRSALLDHQAFRKPHTQN